MTKIKTKRIVKGDTVDKIFYQSVNNAKKEKSIELEQPEKQALSNYSFDYNQIISDYQSYMKEQIKQNNLPIIPKLLSTKQQFILINEKLNAHNSEDLLNGLEYEIKQLQTIIKKVNERLPDLQMQRGRFSKSQYVNFEYNSAKSPKYEYQLLTAKFLEAFIKENNANIENLLKNLIEKSNDNCFVLSTIQNQQSSLNK